MWHAFSVQARWVAADLGRRCACPRLPLCQPFGLGIEAMQWMHEPVAFG